MGQAVFYWDPAFLGYDLGPAHPLKPQRLALTHELTAAYGLLDRPDVSCLSPTLAPEADVLRVHDRGYLELLQEIDRGESPTALYSYGLGTADNPVFPEIYRISSLYTGASLQAAQAVYRGEAEIAFNISGGLHHAHRSRAAGFCVLNDPAVAIAWLLAESDGAAKVLYLDIDAHHGDGVQEAFYADPRVLTVSLHESGRTLFPGTGFVEELGEGAGRGYAVNLPLAPETDDATYLWAFGEIVPPLVAQFAPDFLVAQLGVDTHFNDPLAHLSLSSAAYEQLYRQIRALARGRLIAMGGGGYDIDVVRRAWTLAFGCMLGETLADELPDGSGALRDKMVPAANSTDSKIAREAAARSVNQIKELIFPYHGL